MIITIKGKRYRLTEKGESLLIKIGFILLMLISSIQDITLK